MRIILQLISGAALGGTIVPSVLYLTGRIDLDQSKWALLAATIAWFIATPLWMGKKEAGAA
jgi:Na+/H+ antiporter NhaA